MDRLRELRKLRGYTQEKIAELTGIDQSDYSKIELGKRHFTFEQCKRLALVLGTSMDFLAKLTDNPIPHERTKLDPHLFAVYWKAVKRRFLDVRLYIFRIQKSKSDINKLKSVQKGSYLMNEFLDVHVKYAVKDRI